MIRRTALIAIAVWSCACGSYSSDTETIAALPQIDLTRFEKGLQERLASRMAALPTGDVERTAENANAWAVVGSLLHAHGIEDLALICYLHAVRLNPGYGPVYLAGVLQQQAGDVDKAAATFLIAAEMDNTAVAPLLRTGEIRLQQGDLDAAEQSFRAAQARNTDLAATLGGLGRLALARQEYAEARDMLQQALQQEPGADRLHYPLALAYRGLGDLDRARDHMAKRGARQAYIPDPELERVRNLASTSQTHIKSGLAAYEAGDLLTAAREYRLALDENPALADTHLALAWVLENLGELDASRRHIDASLDLDPGQPKAHYQLGRLHERSGDDVAAIAAYRKAMLAPEYATPPRELLAGALMRQRDYVAASKQYRELSDSEPETARFSYMYGLALLAIGDCAAAAAPLSRARSLSPGSAEAAEAWLRVHSSCARTKSHETQALAAELFSALPEAPFAETYAMALAADNQFERAVQLQQRVADTTGSEFSRSLLQKFRTGEPAAQPWPADAAVFSPPRLND